MEQPLQNKNLLKFLMGLMARYYLFIETDFDKNIFEGKAENNNYSSKPINIQLTPWPDLKMNAVKISKDPVDFEEDFTVEDSVSNDGTLAILGRPWKDLIYIANDTLKPTAIIKDLKGHEILQTQSLKTNEFYKNNLIERVSNDILDPINPDTTFYVYAIADYKNNIYEHTGENNNIKRTKITIRNVDLAVTKVDGSTNVFSGQNANLNWVVLNNGGKTGLFANGWIDQVYLSKDTIFDAQDTMLIYRK
ncbi:MAG: hypothetical protein IPI77_18345 [Saprospiraceae bacterium]|nr:hypothetical protein [Saprospiraceae bacterium]